MPHDPQAMEAARRWLRYAEADLAFARADLPEGGLLEQSCFHAQQAAEKAIKAVLTFLQIDFPKTHNLEYLLNLLPPSIERAEGMDKAFKLTPYATIFRYPGEEEPVGDKEYRRLLQLADQAVAWAKIIIGSKGITNMTNNIIREEIEWTNIWWDHADDAASPRVLLIGDSISVGYNSRVSERLLGKFRVDRLGTSHCITDPALRKETAFVLAEYPYQAIHFNNGLHGWHLSDDEYAAGLRDFTHFLRERAPGVPLVWATSTPVTVSGDVATLHPERTPIVLRRNARAAKVMAEFGIPVNDLYAAVLGKAEIRNPDGYHYNELGQVVLGDAVAEAVLRVMGQVLRNE